MNLLGPEKLINNKKSSSLTGIGMWGVWFGRRSDFLVFLITLVVILSCPNPGGAGAVKVKTVCEFYDSNVDKLELDTAANLNNEDPQLQYFQSHAQPQKGNSSSGGGDDDTQDVDIAKKMMVCGKESQFCYALWTTGDSHNGTIPPDELVPKFLKQGCWEASPPPGGAGGTSKSSGYCQRPACTAYFNKNNIPEGLPPNTLHFCCCKGDYCNAEVTLEGYDDEEEEEDYHHHHEDHEGEHDGGEGAAIMSKSRKAIYIGAIIGIAGFITAIIGLIVARVMLGRRNAKNQRDGDNNENGGGDDEDQRLIGGNDFVNLKKFNEDRFNLSLDVEKVIDQEIANGRWGKIYTTKPHPDHTGKPLALKVYNPEHREFFENEKFIYECFGKDAENILRYYGHVETPTSLVLAFDLVESNLRDYLKGMGASMTVNEMVDILLGIARGISYLHNGMGCDDTIVIAHRDLTSRNILIDPRTRQVSIADFGLSLLTRGSKYFYAGKERQAEFCSLAEAGTLRYMAPELLEGAVNLKDCENALKQADVYSMSLILWEVANACSAIRLETENEQGDCLHGLPYEEEEGTKTSLFLTLDTLVRLVVQSRIRPGFHKWSDMGLTRALRDTLNDSWDSEPDARLTALCIVERIHDMKNHLSHNLNKFTAKSTKPLEKKRVVITEEPAWINRNPCMERNLLFETGSQSASVTDTNSVNTLATNLSTSESGDANHRPSNPNEHLKFINFTTNPNFNNPSRPVSNQNQNQGGLGGGGHPSMHHNHHQNHHVLPPQPPRAQIQVIQNINRK